MSLRGCRFVNLWVDQTQHPSDGKSAFRAVSIAGVTSVAARFPNLSLSHYKLTLPQRPSPLSEWQRGPT
jgi:hypothetical protein